MRESTATSAIVKKWKRALKDTGAVFHFYKISDRFTKAIPDILGVINGRFLAIELKHISELPKRSTSMVLTKHKFTDKQLYELQKLHEAGGISLGVIIYKSKAYMIPDFSAGNFTKEEFEKMEEVEWTSILKTENSSFNLMRQQEDQLRLPDMELVGDTPVKPV